jgi:hypothetical protein
MACRGTALLWLSPALLAILHRAGPKGNCLAQVPDKKKRIMHNNHTCVPGDCEIWIRCSKQNVRFWPKRKYEFSPKKVFPLQVYSMVFCSIIYITITRRTTDHSQLTPRSRVFILTLILALLFEEFPAFTRNRRFTAVFRSARDRTPSLASWMQSTIAHSSQDTYRSLCVPTVLLLFKVKCFMHFSSPLECNKPRPFHSSPIHN